MTFPPNRRHAVALAALLALSGQAFAAEAPAPKRSWTAHGGERLGEWLIQKLDQETASSSGDFDPGLMWIRSSQKPIQSAEKARLLQRLDDLAMRRPASADALRGLSETLRALPVTGRLLLPMTDIRLLPVHPEREPVLSAGDEVTLPRRPGTLTVLHEDGTRCESAYVPGARAADYLRACLRPRAGTAPVVDEVWIVQPEGRVEHVGVSAWNATQQPLPAPGAWLWAPKRHLDWPEDLHTAIAAVLATQGPLEGGLAAKTQPVTPRPTEMSEAQRSPTPSDLRQSINAWGMTGLMETPSARLPRAGQIGFTISRTSPYSRYNASVSPWDAVEIAVRYTRIGNQLYGPDIAGDRAYLDKSSEIKFRLAEEGPWTPAVAVGLRDPGGTGLFGGEYVVASKRYLDLDFHLGLGWGYAGAAGNLPNPFSVFGSRFKERKSADIGQGGTAQLGTLFTGRTAVFGGVQWQTPWTPWLVKLELDGNNHQHEPFGTTLPSSSRLNAAVAWRQGPIELTVGWMRGREVFAGLNLLTSLPSMRTAKHSLPPRPPVDEIPLGPTQGTVRIAPVSTSTAQATQTEAIEAPPQEVQERPAPPAPRVLPGSVMRELGVQTSWTIRSIEEAGDTWIVRVDNTMGVFKRERLDRGTAVLHREAPSHILKFRWDLSMQDIPTASYEVDRTQWMMARTRYEPAAESAVPSAGPRSPLSLAPLTDPLWKPGSPDKLSPETGDRQRSLLGSTPVDRTRSSVHLGFQQHLGGPDGYLFALSGVAQGQVRLKPGLWAQGTAQLRLFDNYENFKYTAPSGLPRVRTYLREYVTDSRFTIPNAQVTHFARWSDNFYSLAYAGLLEWMYAGAGAEVMWQPQQSPWAVTFDINRVAQRDFDQKFSLRDYRVTTGHLSLHWTDPALGLHAAVSAGQYLAGDRGMTMDLARVFNNGTRIGAWVTKTNVSAAQFGEGSFDKGIYVAIPFDVVFSSWSGGNMVLAWQPLIRDGGARLGRAQSLWGLTHGRSAEALKPEAAPPEPAAWTDAR